MFVFQIIKQICCTFEDCCFHDAYLFISFILWKLDGEDNYEERNGEVETRPIYIGKNRNPKNHVSRVQKPE